MHRTMLVLRQIEMYPSNSGRKPLAPSSPYEHHRLQHRHAPGCARCLNHHAGKLGTQQLARMRLRLSIRSSLQISPDQAEWAGGATVERLPIAARSFGGGKQQGTVMRLTWRCHTLVRGLATLDRGCIRGTQCTLNTHECISDDDRCSCDDGNSPIARSRAARLAIPGPQLCREMSLHTRRRGPVDSLRAQLR